MGTKHSSFHKEDGVYDKDEAYICLTCTKSNCKGECERLRKEKAKLKRKNNKDVK